MMRLRLSSYRACVFVAALGLICGCSKENASDRQIASGVTCIDQAQTANDADNCVAKVNGLTSPQSYLIRCSADMIAQGFTGTRVGSAFQQLKTNNGSNQTAGMLAYFVFAKNLPAHTADVTLSDCTASGSKSVTFLASLFKTATLAAQFAAGAGTSLDGGQFDPSNPSFDPTKILSAFNAAYTANDPATNTTIGNLAISAQSSYCANGSSLSTQDVCTKLNAALATGSGNPGQIGYALLGLLKQ